MSSWRPLAVQTSLQSATGDWVGSHHHQNRAVVAYVAQGNLVEVVPRASPNCTEEIPISWNNTSLYMDPTQLRYQVCSLTHQVQAHCPAQVEHSWAMVSCIHFHPGVCTFKKSTCEPGTD
jgi:hypothetical protein